MNCLRHELCLAAHWLQFNSWRRRHADEKSWWVQFMMRQHQFIYHNKQSKNRRFNPFILALFCGRMISSPTMICSNILSCPKGISCGEATFQARSAFHKSRKGFISLRVRPTLQHLKFCPSPRVILEWRRPTRCFASLKHDKRGAA